MVQVSVYNCNNFYTVKMVFPILGIHLPLLVIASVSTVFVIFPFILVGTFGSLCLRYKIVDKIRPVIDAMHGPYRDRFRFWYGARLLLLVSIAIRINPVYLPGKADPYFKHLLQLFFVSVFTAFQAYIKPFTSTWINVLDIWCMLNVMALLFIDLFATQEDNKIETLLLLNIIIMSITIIIVFGYHTRCFFRKLSLRLSCCKFLRSDQSVAARYFHTKFSINDGIWTSRKGYISINDDNTIEENVENRELIISTDSSRIDYSALREPFIELSNSS